MNTDLLSETWAKAEAIGDRVPAWFYAFLFLKNPELRRMFQPGMADQRDRLVTALGDIVSKVDDLDALVPVLRRLGRDHVRRYGVRPEHYPLVGEALLATLAFHLGDAWTPEVAGTWAAAYQVVADVMATAADPEPFEQQEVAP